MIFFAATDGTIIKTLMTPVYQGSANANMIYLVAPFASNTSVTVAFQLPNGVWTTPRLMDNVKSGGAMTPQGTLAIAGDAIVDKATGRKYAVWTCLLDGDITRYYGTVTAQFLFYGASAGVVAATSAASFPVSRGIPPVLPDEPEEDVYRQILSVLSDLRAQLDNGKYPARSIYAWNSEYVYGANEIAFYPDVGEYGAFVKSLVIDNTSPPFDALGELNASWAIVMDFNDLYTYLNYGVQIRSATLTFSPLDANVSVQDENLIIKRSCL